MPYRVAADRSKSDARVVCRRCARARDVCLADHEKSFVCERCTTEQPIVPDLADLDSLDLALISAKKSSYDDLVRVVVDLGGDASSRPLSLGLTCAGMTLTASLSLNSGTVTGLDLLAAQAGLPQMRLLREDAEHVVGKEDGFLRECQTGHAPFDAAVYIESSASDAAIKTMFTSPAVREATIELLQLADRITVGADTVSVNVSNDREPFEPWRFRELASWLRVLAGAPRPIEVTYTRDPAAVKLVRRLTYGAVPLGILACVFGMGNYAPLEGRHLVMPALGGLVAAVALQPILTRVFRGRSTARRELPPLRFASIASGPFLVVGVLMIVNGAFDRSAERVESLAIGNPRADSDDDGVLWVDGVDSQGIVHSNRWRRGEVQLDKRMIIGARAGALGWEWKSRPPALVSP